VFDLTPAEIRILQRLLAGSVPSEIADELGLALPTVRTHLGRIFAKTGTSRQSDLILLATELAAPVSGRCPPAECSEPRHIDRKGAG
jgi:DNA-binding CsgD family transcriptional regulator